MPMVGKMTKESTLIFISHTSLFLKPVGHDDCFYNTELEF